MNSIKYRSLFVLIITLLLIIGAVFYVGRFIANGGDWATFAANEHIYDEGVMISGSIYDCNGEPLLVTENGRRVYSDDPSIRRSTVHLVGDRYSNIATSIQSLYDADLAGYGVINGLYSLDKEGNDLYLTVDAQINKVAYEALNGRNGCVAVYNYQSGDLVCLVSSPNFDPNSEVSDKDLQANEGLYINRFFSSTFVPGSVFKLVTMYASIEKIDDIFSREFTCTGSVSFGDEKVTCPSVHGTMDIYDALACSCNCVFAELAQELGGKTLSAYAKKAGLTSSLSAYGYTSAKGIFDIAEDGSADLSWSGIGQYHDMINPCAMLTYMGAIANDGKGVSPKLVDKVRTSLGIPGKLNLFTASKRLLSQDTAATLSEMMKYNVVHNYGESSFPGLDIYAKSGTAEVASGAPHSWFVGFIRNDDYPLAFVVMVENGGSGARVAGGIANKVLSAIVND